MDTVAIAGVGLIGGSFALAIREAGFRGTILGVSSPATIETAMRMGVIDEGVTLQKAAERADLIYLAQPILSIIDALTEIGDRARPETLITDAGSTKAQIMSAARDRVSRALFIGGHPMAGKETRGVAAADASLFRGRPYVLTPRRRSDLDEPAAAQFREWLERIGAQLVVLDAEEHDRRTALVSHVPQLLSTALASLLSERDDATEVAGPAVIELTRLAMSPWDVWRDIIVTNGRHINDALEQLIAKLNDYQAKLSTADLEPEFRAAGALASRLRKQAGT
ncbi:MAG TPA: prephenate dehydrogenase [Bryobacteraceae bacterium]|nr:prephenate dehydrogenase [Bryobacteraceae bacterium]